MPAARPRLARLIVTAVAITLLVAVADASAATRRIAATSVTHGAATFKLRGVAPNAVRSARLSAGADRRAVRLATIRGAARRGTLRIRLGASARRAGASANVKPLLLLTLRGGASAGERDSAPAQPGPAVDGARPRAPQAPAATGARPAAPAAATPGAVPDAPAASGSSPTDPGDAKPGTAPNAPAGGSSSPTDPGTGVGTDPSVGIGPPPGPERIPADARYVAAGGSDADSGTAAAPWRTLAKAVAAARPGDTVVLREGSFGAVGTTTTVGASGSAAAPITFVGDPAGARPSLQGYIRITGSHLRFANLRFDGPTGRVLPTSDVNPKGEEVKVSVMYGDDVEIRSSEVRGSAWHAGIYVNDATDVRLLGNHIHDNGDRGEPAQANLDHGIYWCSGSGVVANNLIEDNVAYGVHLYPTAADVTVARNTIVGNGRGGVIVANRASQNTIARNVIAQNGLAGIKAYNLTGTGNVATGNVLWANGSRDLDGTGIAFAQNVQANPMFVGNGDYRPRAGSPAADAGAFATL